MSSIYLHPVTPGELARLCQPCSPAAAAATPRPDLPGWSRRVGGVGCSVLPGPPAGEPFTYPHHVDEVVHGRPPACRAQKFPEAISFNAAFSSSASASSRFSVAFSRSRSFSLLASSAFNPPNWFRHR